MTLSRTIESSLTEHLATIEAVRTQLTASIEKVGLVLANTIRGGGTIFWCGNGGSAADSQHMAAELVGRFQKNRRALRSIALVTDTSVITAVGNDFGYDDVFSRQVEALASANDALVGITTSGSSENVLRAIRTAKGIGTTTIALAGGEGGPVGEIADHAIAVPSEVTARIQEAHTLIGHLLCEIIEIELGLA